MILIHHWPELNCYDSWGPEIIIDIDILKYEKWYQAWKNRNYAIDMLFLELIAPEIYSLEIFYEFLYN